MGILMKYDSRTLRHKCPPGKQLHASMNAHIAFFKGRLLHDKALACAFHVEISC